MLMFHNGSRVKSYSSSSRSGKHVLKVELEYDDAYDLAYDMKQLDERLAEQKAAKAPRRKPLLALPAPEDNQ